MLEEAPDVMRLEAILFFPGQKDLAAQNVIVLLGVRVKLAHLNALNEAILSQIRVREHFEQTLALVVVSLRLIG